MKHMNRILALALALIMVLGLATTASAAGAGSITVTNPHDGAVYNAYQILELEHFDAENQKFIYKATPAWITWLRTQTQYVSVDDEGYVTWVEGAKAADFADAAKDLLDGKPIAGTVTAAGGAATIDGLALGYYLIDTTLGALCSLDTTAPTANVTEKNEVPVVTKEVKEDSTGKWGKVNDADINQVVEFKATVTVQKGAENYIIHDLMSEELNFLGITSVKIGDTVVSADNYTLTPNVAHTEGAHKNRTCTFDLEFKNEFIETLEPGTVITVLYTAKLNEKAVVATGVPNELDMQYGDKNDPEWTPTHVTKTYTWDMNIIKVDGKTKEALAGAEFKLTTDEAGEKALKFHALGNNKYEVCAAEDGKCSNVHVTSFTTDASGKVSIEGLDSGKYYLHEIKAPAGYNKLGAAVEVEIVAEETNSGTEMSYTPVEKSIENNAGVELPDTGGIGTTIFYIVGGMLAVAAVVLLVTKKRMAAAE